MPAEPEEAHDECHLQHSQFHAVDEDIAAAREALDDVTRGDRGIPFDDFDRDFRKRHNLPA